MKQRVLLPILLALSIFMCSSFRIAPIPLDTGFIAQDKLIHFLVYGLLAISICRCHKGQKASLSMQILSILITALYGVSDEIHQYFTPGRYFEYLDMLADTLGALTGVLTYCHFSIFHKILEFRVRAAI